MLLIQRLTSIFCFILLILKRATADVASCRSAVVDLFNVTSVNLKNFRNGPRFIPLNGSLDYYFIPNEDLICLLIQLPNPDYKCPGFGAMLTVPNPEKKYLGEAYIQNPVKFGTFENNWKSVKFSVQHTDGRRGIAKIVCRGTHCDHIVSNLEKFIVGSNKLLCLEQPDVAARDVYAPKLQVSDEGEIHASWFGRECSIFHDKPILQMLDLDPDMIPLVDKASFDDKESSVVLHDKLGKFVSKSSWPQKASSVGVELIQAAIDFKNHFKVQSKFPGKEKKAKIKALIFEEQRKGSKKLR